MTNEVEETPVELLLSPMQELNVPNQSLETDPFDGDSISSELTEPLFNKEQEEENLEENEMHPLNLERLEILLAGFVAYLPSSQQLDYSPKKFQPVIGGIWPGNFKAFIV